MSTINYLEELFGAGAYEDKVIKREEWGLNEPRPEGIKRKHATDDFGCKKKKVVRGDELVVDPQGREAAKVLFDQIKLTPGTITFDYQNPKTLSVLPLDQNLAEITQSSWKVGNIQEGQLKSLLSLAPSNFGSLAIGKIKGKVNKTILNTRGVGLPTIKKSLRQLNKSEDEYVSFASAIANVLRRCDSETGESVANEISEILEQHAIPHIG